MKKIHLTLIVILSLIQFSYAQWTTSGSNIYNGNTGNVGVGTASPSYPLEVNGTAKASNLFFPNIGAAVETSDGVNGMFINGGATGSYIQFFNNSSVHMTLLASGNVGIGTTSPGALLDINSLGTGYGVAPKLQLTNYAGKKWEIQSGIAGISDNSFGILNVTDAVQALTILSTGNIGIGTTSPGTYKLAVNGNVHAQQVNIDMTGWSDYVFNSNYVLPPLEDVKAYIDENHHLPEIPSEQEIIKDGLNLGEMNKLLVKKVEELTLYLIENGKKDSDQQTELHEQKQKLLDQEKHIKLLEKKLDELLNKNY